MNTTNDTPVELSPADQHLAFKNNLVTALHEIGDQENWCSEFDQTLVGAGLPGRDTFYNDQCCDQSCCRRPDLVGEDSVDDFETWKHEVARKLHRAAKAKSQPDQFVNEIAVKLGLPTRDAFYRNLKVEGTFMLRLPEHEVTANDDITKQVSKRDIAMAISRSDLADGDHITWNAVIED